MSVGLAAVSFPVRSPASLTVYSTQQIREICWKRYTVSKNLLSLWKGVYTFRLLWLTMTKLPEVEKVWKIKSDKVTCCLFIATVIRKKPQFSFVFKWDNKKNFHTRIKVVFVIQQMKIYNRSGVCFGLNWKYEVAHAFKIENSSWWRLSGWSDGTFKSSSW